MEELEKYKKAWKKVSKRISVKWYIEDNSSSYRVWIILRFWINMDFFLFKERKKSEKW